ncbi:MAG: hypothetical protein AAGF94_03625 [Pseudomonadota bacterium]
MTPLRPVLPLLLLPGLALADPAISTVTSGTLSGPPNNWLGEEPHFAMVGTVNGYDFNVYLSDMTRAMGVTKFEGKREYKEDRNGLRYRDVEFTLEAIIEGVDKEIDLEFKSHDFNASTLPGDFTLQSRAYPEGNVATMEVEFEWDTGGKSVDEEVDGWDGLFTFALNTGDEMSNGALRGGKVGGFVNATNGNDRLSISFTVPVTKVDVDD